MFKRFSIRTAYLTRPKGFTLVEMMVVVAIVAILAALAAPDFTRFIQRTEVNSARDSLEASIFFARTEAIRTGAVTTVRPLCPGTLRPWDCGWQVTTGNTAPFTVLRQVELGPGVGLAYAMGVGSTPPSNCPLPTKNYCTGPRGSIGNARFDIGAPKGTATPEYGNSLCISRGGRVRTVTTFGTCP